VPNLARLSAELQFEVLELLEWDDILCVRVEVVSVQEKSICDPLT
jgi:hypothetical protein